MPLSDLASRVAEQHLAMNPGDHVLDYNGHKREVDARIARAEEGLRDLQGALTEMADWVRDHQGQSEPKLRAASSDLERLLGEVHSLRRLVR